MHMNESEQAKKMREMFDNMGFDKYPLSHYDAIGKKIPRRIDGIKKASGEALYTMDVRLPGMLYLKFLTSPYPHAEVLSVNTRKALAIPGVRYILTCDDPEIPLTENIFGHSPGHPINECPLPRTAHFEGQPVGAAVVADSESIADEAIRALEVEWSQRSFIMDGKKAMDPDSVLAWPEKFSWSNYFNKGLLDELNYGSIEKGFKEAEKIIEFETNRKGHTWAQPERPCGVVRWNGEVFETWVKSQRPHTVKRCVSTWFGGIPMNKIIIHMLSQGGSFGGWAHVNWHNGPLYCAALVSKRLRQPIKYTMSRRDDFYGGSSDEGTIRVKVGFKNDGTITAVDAYAMHPSCLWPIFSIVKHLWENTKISNIHGKVVAPWVNRGPNVPLRCEMIANCLTQTMVFDKVAAELSVDPIDLVLKHDGAEGHDINWLNEKKKEGGFEVRDSLWECIQIGKKAVDWENKWHAPGVKKLKNGRLHGIAFTFAHQWDEAAGSGECSIRIERNDGTATIISQGCDQGVDAENSLCIIAADELGFRVEDVFYFNQTDAGFFRMTPDTSSGMVTNGWAVRHAARIVKEQILKAATSISANTQRGGFPPAFPQCSPDDLDIKDSLIFVKKNPAQSMRVADFVKQAGQNGPLTNEEYFGSRYGYTEPFHAVGYHVQTGTFAPKNPRLRFCRQCYFMEVEVDPETGETFITKIVTVNDVGKAINPLSCNGQQYGGAFMALGRCILEELIFDEATGVLLNGNLIDYKIATMLDCDDVETHLVESGMGHGPYGSVGIGESVATVLPGIIGPAIYNAIGVYIDEYPITPDRILKALGKA